MARMIPAVFDPATASPGEKFLFDRLSNDPGTQGWTVLHSLTLPRHIRQAEGEVDFVVCVPGSGVLCLEVKAHQHVHRDSSGMWHLGSYPASPRSPFKQASDGMHSLRKELVKHAPALDRVPFTSAVAFTHIDCDLSNPAEWHDWQLLDARALLAKPISANLERVLRLARDHYRAAGKQWLSDTPSPTADQVDVIVRTLRPAFELVESRKTARARTRDEVRRYTEEQYSALDSLASAPRLLFNGPAGTGKTFLAIEAARRASRAGARVLLACFNKPLARWLEKELAGEPFDVRTFHSHLLEAAGSPKARDAPGWWSKDLPDLALDRLLDSGPRYDVLVVDEAQDLMTTSYLDCMEATVADGLAGGTFRFFSDLERQALYGCDADAASLKQRAPDLVRFDLFTNCRNTPAIAEYTRAVAGLESGYRRILRADNGHLPETHYYASEGQQGELLAAAFDRLRARRIEPADVVVLSAHRDNAAVRQLRDTDPWRRRLDTDGDGHPGWVKVRTIHSFKGLEAPVVVLTGVADVTSPDAQSLLYVALSRPTERLVVVADERVRPALVQLITDRLFNTEAPA